MTDYNPFTLAGRTVLVTGASSGIGRASAIECSRMGARLIVCGRHEERTASTLSELAGDGHQLFVGDLVNSEEIERLVADIDTVDGAVLSAGRGMTRPFLFSSRDKLDTVFDINFFSPVELLRQLVKKKKLVSGSSVVVIDSIAGYTTYSKGNSAYGASKAALMAMVKFSARELASKRVRVNAVCPGMVETPLIHPSTLTSEQLEANEQSYPLKRYGQPEEVAYAAVYLLSNAAAWVTGQAFVLDGGRSIT